MHPSDKVVELLGLVIAFVFITWAVSSVVKWVRGLFQYVTIYNFQRGIHYRDGKLAKVLEAGRYLCIRNRDTVTTLDMRQVVLNVVNQEVVCADNLSIRLSSSVVYHIKDPVVANENSRNNFEILYLDTQLLLRELVAGMKVEDVLLQRNELSTKLEEALKPRAAVVGLAVDRAGIRDITFPADVKKTFGQLAHAEKSAQAALAKSRGETASLRALANAAKMIEGNPNILALRTLQSISELSSSTGNTIVLGVPAPLVPIGAGNGSTQSPDSSPESE